MEESLRLMDYCQLWKLEIEAEGKALKVESSIAIIKVDELIKIDKILY